MSENNFWCFTFNAGVEQFGGDIPRFVKFHVDNMQVLLDYASCGDFPPFEVMDRFMSLASSVSDMDKDTVMVVKQCFREHGCSFISRCFSYNENPPSMHVRMFPTFGNRTSPVDVYASPNNNYGPDPVMITTADITFGETQYGGRFEGFGVKHVKVNYMDSDPQWLNGMNSDFEEMRIDWNECA